MWNKKMKMRMIKKILLMLLILIPLTGCGSNEKDESVIEEIAELNGRNMGCMSGSIFDVLIEKLFRLQRLSISEAVQNCCWG